MGVLDLKLLRDLRRLWPQALAIALVMAAGVATLVLGTGAVASLDRSRAAYYADNAFADLFASVTRAPHPSCRRARKAGSPPPGSPATSTRCTLEARRSISRSSAASRRCAA